MRLVPLALAALATVGCAPTLMELRAAPPTRTATVVAPSPRDLAACTMNGLEMAPGAALVYRLLTVDGRSYVTGAVVGNMARQYLPFFEASFAASSPGHVQVTTRAAATLGPVGRDAEEAAWPIIERCAGS